MNGKVMECWLRQHFLTLRRSMECVISMQIDYHKDAIAVSDAFVERMSGKQEDVLIQLREGARETIPNNRKKLCSFTEIIFLYGRQNIVLCGHCDSGTDMDGVQAACTNHGKFVIC